MTTRVKRKPSSAVAFLESLVGGSQTLGRAIQALRICDEVTQAELASRLGITRAHLCDVEKDRRTVGPARAAQWAKEMGYPPALFVELALQTTLMRDNLPYRVHVTPA
jgi:antitoxin HigA-1